MVVGNIQYSGSILNPMRYKDKVLRVILNASGSNRDLPTIESKRANKAIDWIGKNISSPENRLILGVSALMSQPFIDAANKNVDDETRRYSVGRTVAKIVAGTTTGVLIRKGCISAIDAFTKSASEITPDMKFKKLRSAFLPTISHTANELGQYKNTIGSLLALGVMLFTNFLIDAPLTKFLTNVFVGQKGVNDDNSK